MQRELATISDEAATLPALLARASMTLAGARSAAEVLEAKEAAGIAYDVARRAERLARAKQAHDDLIGAIHRVKADALKIEYQAQQRIADEYDAAQERGEVGRAGTRNDLVPVRNEVRPARPEDLGLTRKQVYKARIVRDAERASPGSVNAAVDVQVEAGVSPTRATAAKLISAGDASAVRAAYKELQAEAAARKRETRAERERETAAKISALPDQRFGVIYADPEWRFEPYSRESGMDRAPENHYATSPTEAIKERNVGSIAAEDCALFLWATAPMLPDALDVMAAWGFSYKSQIVWVKDRIGTGYWARSKHEILLIGTRGSVPAPSPGTQPQSAIEAPVGAHSAKPEVFAEIIERLFPNIPKIELNRRGTPRPGWAAWGAEALSVNEAA